MMKLKMFLLCLGWLSLSQAQQLRPTVLASAGASLSSTGNTARLNFTVGEVAITGMTQPGFSYGQGFHNGALQTSRVTNLDLAHWNIEVWPNPVVQTLFLQYTPPAEDAYLKVSVWNLLGQPVLSEIRLDGSTQQSIAVGHLPAGVYLLRLAAPDGASASLKFVKSTI